MQLFILSAVVIAVAMLGMAVGVLLSNRCLRGSCGGPDVLGPNGKSLTCATCPNRDRSTEKDPSLQTTV
jgi:hypothetical protein